MRHNLLTYILLSILLAWMNTSCKDDIFLSPTIEEEDGSGIYVSVVINTGGTSASRVGSTPTPGENGDGPQHGVGVENEIYDLVVFFFQGDVTADGKRLGINSSNPENIQVDRLPFNIKDFVKFYATDYDAVYYSATKEVSEIGLKIGQTYDILVVANVTLKGINDDDLKTLKDLQDAAYSDIMNPVTYEGPIAMSSARMEFDSKKGINSVEIKATNTKNNPAVVQVDVERMIARIDCHINENGIYDVTGRPKDKVTLESFIVINKYVANVDLLNSNYFSYWFKRVADADDLSANSDITYLGNETTVNNIASNYVVGPMTLTPPAIIDRTENFPYDHSLYYYKDNTSGWEENWISTTELLNRQLTSTHNNVTYYFLDYVQENVLPVEALNQENGMAYYCTGIVFKAKYQPAGITTTDGTFYRYNGKFYASLNAIKTETGNQNISEYNFSQFGITKYEDGICYYTYFIKHAEDGDDTTVSPMEYAIVRNNIYQVNVKGINDIGSVTPTDYRLNLECTVADWITENEITIDFSNNYDGDILGVNVVKDDNDVFVAYSQDNKVRDAQFKFQMNTPVGVGWTAHLTNPNDFEFVGDYHGVGNGGPVTLQILPRRPFEEGVKRSTRMYITMDTDNEPVAFNQGTEPFPGNTQYIDIRQVSTTEYDALTNQDNNT